MCGVQLFIPTYVTTSAKCPEIGLTSVLAILRNHCLAMACDPNKSTWLARHGLGGLVADEVTVWSFPRPYFQQTTTSYHIALKQPAHASIIQRVRYLVSIPLRRTPNLQSCLSSAESYARTMFGTLFHLGFDALLLSAFLAGVKRSTGLTYVLTSF